MRVEKVGGINFITVRVRFRLRFGRAINSSLVRSNTLAVVERPFITFIVRVKNTEQLAIRKSYHQEVSEIIALAKFVASTLVHFVVPLELLCVRKDCEWKFIIDHWNIFLQTWIIEFERKYRRHKKCFKKHNLSYFQMFYTFDPVLNFI